MRKLTILLLTIATVMTVVYTGSTLQARELEGVETDQPTDQLGIYFDMFPLDQQLKLISRLRPKPEPIVLPVQRYVPPPRPLEPEWVRTLIEKYFHVNDVEWALRVSYCESRWDASAKNPSSSASGLFQHLARYWDDRSARAGWAGASIWDAEANTAVAAWLHSTGGPGHWVCK